MNEADHTRLLGLQQCAELRPVTAFCPEDQLIAEFFEGHPEHSERRRLERHLAECRVCRARVGIIARLHDPRGNRRIPESVLAAAKQLPSRTKPTRKPRTAAWATAAMIVIAPLVLVTTHQERSDPTATAPLDATGEPARQLRNADANAYALQLLYPAAEAEVEPQSVIRWNEVRGTVHYQIRVLNLSGDVLLDTRTATPRWPLNETSSLQPGEKYYVRVEATLADGRLVPSRHVPFRFVEAANHE